MLSAPKGRGAAIKTGTIVDATVIRSASQEEPTDCQRESPGYRLARIPFPNVPQLAGIRGGGRGRTGTPRTRSLSQEFARLTDPARSWKVSLERGRLTWTGGMSGQGRVLHREPDAPLTRRVLARVLGWLPIEPQL